MAGAKLLGVVVVGKHEVGYARVERDFYPTPTWVIAALAEYVALTGVRIWEPACGDGGMAEALKAAGAIVYSTDIVDRGYSGFDAILDFLRVAHAPTPFDKIVTNPPYGERNKTAEQFIERGLLHIAGGGLLALLLPSDFDAAKTRRHLFTDCPDFAAKIVLTRRIKWFETPPGELNKSPKENHAWFIWRRTAAQRPRARPIILYAPKSNGVGA
jgi:hypothetical protein